MKLENAIQVLEPITNKPFKDFLTDEQMKGIRINKGLTGQLLELQLGLENSSRNLDFEDGELKSNKVDIDGKPLETMYIKQISSMIDDLLSEKNFFETKLYKKINNILHVPVYKGSRKNKVNRKEWRLLPYIHIKLSEHPQLKKQLEEDYYNICKLMKKQLDKSQNSYLHTCNGKYIQIRTKDSKPYNAIYSNVYNRIVSDKNRAFYFKKEFIKKIQEFSSSYPIQL
ncbi:DNA mismatch repair protein MutH [Halanaerobium saccharolyticum]|uniref:DNA mismatch repair protein MutH n=1 Tax=Halanaerobium saccharolyticum TaxID=43595 RepID=A0A2T5RI43_9FIRM|nr:MutH/Sau3AI family endonuclease [Halanaerobium saccharolyticum]PTV97849.1 DNA mismatch repair protein MutH [Halanaerobium saccharolyticum]